MRSQHGSRAAALAPAGAALERLLLGVVRLMSAIMSAVLTYFRLIVTPKSAISRQRRVRLIPGARLPGAPKGALTGHTRPYRESSRNAKAQRPSAKGPQQRGQIFRQGTGHPRPGRQRHGSVLRSTSRLDLARRQTHPDRRLQDQRSDAWTALCERGVRGRARLWWRGFQK